MKTIILMLIASSFIYSQAVSSRTVYEIPFASKGNEIELSVLNDSGINLSDVKITAIEKPDWIRYENEVTEISTLNSQTEGTVTFKFDVEQMAEVLTEQRLRFMITGNNQSWEKEIKITVLPPEKFELNQNYPNLFNPLTTISYTIPVASSFSLSQEVRLTIYDLLGREVETIVNEAQSVRDGPGYYKVEWNASNYASGMYIYQLSMKSGNKTELQRKKLMLMK